MDIEIGILDLQDCDHEDELTLSDVSNISDSDDEEDSFDCRRCEDQGCNHCLMTGY